MGAPMIDKLIPAIQFILEAVGVPEKIANVTARMLPRIMNLVSALIAKEEDPETALHAALDTVEAGWIETERAKFEGK